MPDAHRLGWMAAYRTGPEGGTACARPVEEQGSAARTEAHTMMARRVLRVTTELIAVEVGHWCNRCLTSAGIRVRYAVGIGPSLCFHPTTACQDCEHDDVELVDTPTTIWQS